MKTQEKKAVAVSLSETPKNESLSLMVVKKKLTLTEKLDKIQSFDSIHGKYEYLKECKENLEKFDKSKNDFSGSKLILKEGHSSELTVSNPIVIQEMVKIARMRITEQLKIVENEINDFELS
jgi:hypothetical protein